MVCFVEPDGSSVPFDFFVGFFKATKKSNGTLEPSDFFVGFFKAVIF